MTSIAIILYGAIREKETSYETIEQNIELIYKCFKKYNYEIDIYICTWYPNISNNNYEYNYNIELLKKINITNINIKFIFLNQPLLNSSINTKNGTCTAWLYQTYYKESLKTMHKKDIDNLMH